MCGGNKVVTTPALDAAYIKRARIAFGGTMYKPSLAFLFHCKDLVLWQEDRKPKGFSKASILLSSCAKGCTSAAENVLPGSGWCKTTSFLKGMAPEPSLQEKLVAQVFQLPEKLSISW